MIGLALRLTVLLGGTMLLAVLTVIGFFYLQRDGTTNLLQGNWPSRVAAIVQALEAATPAQTPALLRALSSPDLSVSVHDGPLPPPSGEAVLPRLSVLLQRRLDTLEDRPARLEILGTGRWTGTTEESAPAAGAPMRIRIALHDGRHAQIEVRGMTLRLILRRPFLATAMLLLAAIGLAALWALRSQIRPLERLAAEVERYGTGDDRSRKPLPQSGPREVSQLVQSFERMRGRIDALVEARTRLLAAISHDLGTYLTRLRLRIELIGDDEQRERAERDIADMHQLLRDSLALARAEQPAAALERVDLVALAQREVRARDETGESVALQAGAASAAVSGHALSLARVITNLAGNAVKYAGHADLSITRNGSQIELLVEDRGAGIPADEQDAVLEPFYRRDPARTLDDGGAGLGLAIAADIVRSHGGTLGLEDRPGGGLRVRVRLPAA